MAVDINQLRAMFGAYLPDGETYDQAYWQNALASRAIALDPTLTGKQMVIDWGGTGTKYLQDYEYSADKDLMADSWKNYGYSYLADPEPYKQDALGFDAPLGAWIYTGSGTPGQATGAWKRGDAQTYPDWRFISAFDDATIDPNNILPEYRNQRVVDPGFNYGDFTQYATYEYYDPRQATAGVYNDGKEGVLLPSNLGLAPTTDFSYSSGGFFGDVAKFFERNGHAIGQAALVAASGPLGVIPAAVVGGTMAAARTGQQTNDPWKILGAGALGAAGSGLGASGIGQGMSEGVGGLLAPAIGETASGIAGSAISQGAIGAGMGAAGAAVSGQDIGQGALSGGIGGLAAGAATPLTNSFGSYIGDTTGISPQWSNAISGGLVNAGTNAAAQAILNGDINANQVLLSGAQGAYKGYKDAPAAAMDAYDDYPSQQMIDAGTANPTAFQDYQSWQSPFNGETFFTYDDYPSQAMIDQGIANPTAYQPNGLLDDNATASTNKLRNIKPFSAGSATQQPSVTLPTTSQKPAPVFSEYAPHKWWELLKLDDYDKIVRSMRNASDSLRDETPSLSEMLNKQNEYYDARFYA